MRHVKLLLVPLLLLLLLPCIAARAHADEAPGAADESTALTFPPPSIYWVSSPTLANETVVIAGSFPGKATTLALCTTPTCKAGSRISTDWSATPWPHSVKVVLPPDCGPPCFLQLAGPGPGASATSQSELSSAGTVVAINAPDIWWALSGEPSHTSADSGPHSRDVLSNQPLRAHVRLGDAVRVFGRSLAWSKDNAECLSAAKSPQPVATTQLYLSADEQGKPVGSALASTYATCYEATFATATLAPGNYPSAVLVTQWGVSRSINLTVEAVPTPKVHVIRVGPQQAGALPAAIAEASRYHSDEAHAMDQVNISMEAGLFKLIEAISLPARTNLIGAGAGSTILEFDLQPPPPPPAPPAQCSKPYVLADFYTKSCADRGCHTRECPGCFVEINAIHTAYTADGCCAACGQNPRCNAWTFIGSVDLPGGYCSLNYCPDEPAPGHNSSCASTPSEPNLNNRTSGWVLNRTNITIPTTAAAAIVVTGHANRIQDFSLRMTRAFPQTPAVWAQPNATQFAATGLNITLLQSNVSNAFKIEAVGFEVANNTMNQVGSCLWPNYGPKSDSTPFQPSVTIYVHNARAGRLASNTVYWRCSAFDLDGARRPRSHSALTVVLCITTALRLLRVRATRSLGSRDFRGE